MLVAQRRLALAEENRDRFARILDVNTIRFKKGYIAEVDLIRSGCKRWIFNRR